MPSEQATCGPEDHKALVNALTADLTDALGENLYSCVLYSHDVRGDVPPEPTELGILIILI